jgi:hypothetical protein
VARETALSGDLADRRVDAVMRDFASFSFGCLDSNSRFPQVWMQVAIVMVLLFPSFSGFSFPRKTIPLGSECVCVTIRLA